MLSAVSLDRVLGEKGVNHSIATARARSELHHVGLIDNDEHWLIDIFKKKC